MVCAQQSTHGGTDIVGPHWPPTTPLDGKSMKHQMKSAASNEPPGDEGASSLPSLKEVWTDTLETLERLGFPSATCVLRHDLLPSGLCVLRSDAALSNVADLAARELPLAPCRGGFTVSLSVDQRAGWILKPVDSDSSMRPDRKVAAQRVAIQSYALFMRILDDQLTCETEPKSLSRRERECLTLLAQGLRTQRIAERIAISPATIEFHFKSARKKLGALTREQALAISVQNGWVQV